MNKLISIYTVFNNYPIQYLSECINGIKFQTYDNYEYIFVIYGKGNDYENIIKVLSGINIKVFLLDDTEVFITAIQYAISECSGEYVIRADADDILMPNALLNMYNYIEEKDLAIVIPDYTSDCDNAVHKGKDLPGNALIERDKYNYIKYLPNQEFRDGKSLLKTFRRYAFGIGYLRVPCFFYRDNVNSLTSNIEEVNRIDKEIENQEIK